ncbi:hypothetical protein EV702DRAFT_1202544 [Suillus placidus]|uniref:Uncharacterized protein n=1 Tax=Suillus placidus TaxID=48579 RepID=A0A9P7CYV1_9AGAM|nr:hypothetical protein EV702DRAFT_1202544 [Suillus placidus]
MSDLQPVLTELAWWLRHSDEEPLCQSFVLLQTVLECFQTTDVSSSEATFDKLNKHVKASRKHKFGTSKTKLHANQIAQLEDALTSFEEKEVEVVSVVCAPQAPPTKPHQPPLQKAQAAARKQIDAVPRKPTESDQLKPDIMKGTFPKFQDFDTTILEPVQEYWQLGEMNVMLLQHPEAVQLPPPFMPNTPYVLSASYILRHSVMASFGIEFVAKFLRVPANNIQAIICIIHQLFGEFQVFDHLLPLKEEVRLFTLVVSTKGLLPYLIVSSAMVPINAILMLICPRTYSALRLHFMSSPFYLPSPEFQALMKRCRR